MDNAQIPFVHLHVHTQYSLLDGAIRIPQMIKRAHSYGMESVAITDHGTMFGTVDFYQQAIKAGIKPIIGCECYVAPRRLTDKTAMDSRGVSHLVLLAKNQTGYRNLCKLASVAQLEGFYYRPRIDKELLEAHCEGLIALSACLHGEVPMRIKAKKFAEADEAAQSYVRMMGEGNFFLEVQNNGIPLQEEVNEALFDMSRRLSIPLVATNDCHYLDADHVRAHEVLLCIQTGKTVHEKDRFKFSTDQLYFKSNQEMADYFKDYPEAIANTVEIASRCEVEFDFNTYHFPRFVDDEYGEDLSVDELFEKKVRRGYAQVMEKLTAKDPGLDRAVYDKRLEYELGVIIEMGFPGYFLIVADFINFAKKAKIPVGPGRGSAAGSLVAYSMRITDLDPIKYDLIFERFLNPARKSMPDIDVDFCINGRERVFNYVVEKYGKESVAQIITYGKLKTRAVIRDVGRALGISLADVDVLAKLVPDELGIKLEEALDKEPKMLEMARQRSDVAELIDICRVLEGLPRHASTHAAGVVIGDKPLEQHLPLYKGKKEETVTQFDMTCVEKIGLVKFDFLGLRNLTVIDYALDLIKRQGEPVPDLSDLDLGDHSTFELLGQGDTTGVFQLESSGMKDLLARLRPECFDDIVALVALYRPGPLDSGMTDEFVERKHGRKKVTYIVPQLEPILKDTYGVIVYQEQVMLIASVLANYSMSEADDLRKAMGKKIAELLAQHRKRFVEGSVENDVPEETARTLFEQIEKFGRYGFNKAHSAAYGLIAYQTAYLKAHFPVAFIAALLTSEMNSIDGIVKYVSECKRQQIEILPPDVNCSDKVFVPDGDRIRFGLVAVKNVGEGAIEALIEAREEGGAYTSVPDFFERADLKRINRRVVESLIKCGAFDSLGTKRSSLMAALEDMMDYGQRVQKERNDPQMGLFDMGGGDSTATQLNAPLIPDVTEWDPKQFLTYEKEALGFYLSGHPLDRHQELIQKYATVDIVGLAERPDAETLRIGGLIATARPHRTRKGDPMAFITVEDLSGSVEVLVFPEAFATCEALLEVDRPVFVQGQVQQEENGVKMIADTIIAINDAAGLWTASVHFKVDMTRTSEEELLQLKDVLERHSGPCRGFVHLKNEDGVETVIAMSESMGVQAGVDLSRDVTRLLGYAAVETQCQTAQPPAPRKRGWNGNGRWKSKS